MATPGPIGGAWFPYPKIEKENPFYEQHDRVCRLMKPYDAVLSLGTGIRAGAIHHSHDRAQMAEIGREMGYRTMVEVPGHVPRDEIAGNIMLEKRMSGGAPYHMSGPIQKDLGAGSDHVTAAIGAAAWARHVALLVRPIPVAAC